MASTDAIRQVKFEAIDVGLELELIQLIERYTDQDVDMGVRKAGAICTDALRSWVTVTALVNVNEVHGSPDRASLQR